MSAVPVAPTVGLAWIHVPPCGSSVGRQWLLGRLLWVWLRLDRLRLYLLRRDLLRWVRLSLNRLCLLRLGGRLLCHPLRCKLGAQCAGLGSRLFKHRSR